MKTNIIYFLLLIHIVLSIIILFDIFKRFEFELIDLIFLWVFSFYQALILFHSGKINGENSSKE